VVALVCGFFLAACTELTGPEKDAFSGEAIPQSMGRVIIRLDQPNARTAIPTLDGLHFTLDFTLQGNPDTKVEETLDTGHLTLTVALESGTWDLEVKGYSSKGILTVRGTSNITITAGISSHVAVYLTPDFSEGGTGTLSYSISFPDFVSQAFLGLYPLYPPGTGHKTDISGSPVGTGGMKTAVGKTEDKTALTLTAGSYQALIDLYDDTEHKAAVWTGVVHIYAGSDTLLEHTFEGTNFADSQVVGASEKTLKGKLDAVLSSYPSGSYTIILDSTETVGPLTPLNVTGGKDITLTIEGNGKTVKLDGNGSILTLGAESGSSLTLIVQDITLEGKTDNTDPVVRVKDGGTLELKVGSSLTGNTSSNNGGGVLVESGGTLSMNGGEISGNSVSGSYSRGGGVYIDGGTFTMSGGTISGNETLQSIEGGHYGGGGVFVTNGGTFTMSGGAVSDNSTFKNGSGVFVYEGGTFTMSGGEISDNSAPKNGGGVYISGGTFTMSGGEINGNSASVSGGGVYVNKGILSMSGGEISGNSASSGGGVYNTGTFTMTGGVMYGSDAGDGKANTATDGNSAALYRNGGTSPNTTNATIDKRQVTP
jgi:hypothetical protein